VPRTPRRTTRRSEAAEGPARGSAARAETFYASGTQRTA
jgi:hypothetical protein